LQARVDGRGDAHRNPVLEAEQVVILAVVVLGPQLAVVAGIDQAGVDAQALGVARH
jgi:hypothetical protein